MAFTLVRGLQRVAETFSRDLTSLVNMNVHCVNVTLQQMKLHKSIVFIFHGGIKDRN